MPLKLEGPLASFSTSRPNPAKSPIVFKGISNRRSLDHDCVRVKQVICPQEWWPQSTTFWVDVPAGCASRRSMSLGIPRLAFPFPYRSLILPGFAENKLALKKPQVLLNRAMTEHMNNLGHASARYC